jgi:hypothetical protein
MKAILRKASFVGAICIFSMIVPGTKFAVGQTAHFLVAERPEFAVHGDSYVLPLVDPAAIDHARALITAPPGDLSSIVVARIASGADGVNRDQLASGAPAWSWHVTEFLEFADFTAEILDGWPTFVEEDVDGWIANTGGLIGFWNYTVIAELPVVPEPASATLFVAAAAIVVAHIRYRAR